jgi:hypothetical protein
MRGVGQKRYKVTGLEFNIPAVIFYKNLKCARNAAASLEKAEIRDVLLNVTIPLEGEKKLVKSVSDVQ